jgi:hypothetical protein
MWPELKIVRGKPRHSQSQGSIERANQDVHSMLITWTQTNKTSHWAEGLQFIQFMKNQSCHQGINQSPYEAVFGCKAKVGLSTSQLPAEIIHKFTSQEDLEEAQNEIESALYSAISDNSKKDLSGKSTVNEDRQCNKSSENLQIAVSCVREKLVAHSLFTVQATSSSNMWSIK